MRVLIILGIILGVFFAGYLFAGSVFDQAVDTAIDNKKAEEEGRWGAFPALPQPQKEREQFLNEINQKIPTPTPKIEKDKRDGSQFYNPSNFICRNDSLHTEQLLVSNANCTEWSIQSNGCYERVCCCDSNGQYYCERCCPDASGKCVAYKIKC